MGMPREYEDVAQDIAAELLSKHRGGMLRPADWERTANKLGVAVFTHGHPRCAPGQCLNPIADGQAVIVYNRCLPPAQACLVIVHELAHYIMARELTASLFGHVAVRAYTTAYDERDRIARRVESLVFPGVRKSSAIRQFQAGPV